MNARTLVILYLTGINIFAFALMGYDKRQARRQFFRVPEFNLFLTALLGGSLGSVAGMNFFRHKTRHLSFRIGMPLILILQILIVILILSLPIEFIIL